MYTQTLFKALCISVMAFLANSVSAQKIPAESTRSTLVQRLGLNDVRITYARPGVKGRKVFGELVPYHQVWRTGADYPTFVQFADTIYAGKDKGMLQPGKYALYTIPGKEKWTVIFSRDTALWGAYGYRQERDALRFEVMADNKTEFTETFTITTVNVEDSRLELLIQWERTRISFPIEVYIDDKVIASIREKLAVEPEWGLYWKGARYLLNNRTNPDLALEWINRSVELKPYWANLWTQAQVLAWTGNYTEAVKAGEKATSDGLLKENAPYFPYGQTYKNEIKRWKKKAGK